MDFGKREKPLFLSFPAFPFFPFSFFPLLSLPTTPRALVEERVIRKSTKRTVYLIDNRYFWCHSLYKSDVSKSKYSYYRTSIACVLKDLVLYFQWLVYNLFANAERRDSAIFININCKVLAFKKWLNKSFARHTRQQDNSTAQDL